MTLKKVRKQPFDFIKLPEALVPQGAATQTKNKLFFVAPVQYFVS